VKVRAVVVDVDGTLADGVEKISCTAIETIRDLEEKGVPVLLASGNAVCVLKTLARYIGCTGAIIAEGGAVIEYQGELEVLGNNSEAKSALARLKEEFPGRIVESWSNPYRYADIALKRTVDRNSLSRVVSNFPSLELVDSGFAYHIVNRGLDKGKGLSFAAQRMGIKLDEVIAIGDSETDIEMLEAAGYAVAVANSPDSLKACADYVTSGKDGDGFAEAVRTLFSKGLIESPRPRRRVFISGPIQGMESNQSYRDVLRGILGRYGFDVFDPWDREKVSYASTGAEWWRNVPPAGFIKRDLEDIEKCNYLVVYLPRLSAGSCMELFHAYRKGKETILICELENPSPWIIAHSNRIFKTIGEFEDFLKNISLNKG